MASGSQASTHEPNRYLILGTAGHIDHGKSTLVQALTGIDPDRLPEEKARGMTIELGFAPLPIGDRLFGVVDVPGHERFVRTMVAGATGIDVALLVVAADDGVMPQTREHAQILDLLSIDRGCIAITKSDLVPAARIDEVLEQIAELVEDLTLRDCPVVAVSGTTGAGLDELRETLKSCADQTPARGPSGVFRMAIDRVFTIRGRGTVVTGSVQSGQVQAGDALELMPPGLPVKVREVQTHGREYGPVGRGQRAALNLTGVKHEQVRRGHELATPGFLQPSQYLDASIRLLADAAKPLASHTTARLCIGTTEMLARVVLFDAEKLAPGVSAPAQLRPRVPIVTQHGQRFILRHETASHTMGGGIVLRPASTRTAARLRDNLAGLRALESGGPAERLAEVFRRVGFAERSDMQLACRAGLDPADVAPLQQELTQAGVLINLPGIKRELHAAALEDLRDQAQHFLKRWHARHPSEPGFPAARFVTWIARRAMPGNTKGQKEIGKPLYEHLLKAGTMRVQGTYVCHLEFAPALSGEDQSMLDELLRRYQRSTFQPPTIPELRKELGRSFPRAERMISHALSQELLVRIDSDILLHTEVHQQLKQTVRELIASQGPVTVAQIRRALGSTRKFVVPICEHLDRIGFTRRSGDTRTLP